MRIGDEGWEVEWTTDVLVDEYGDCHPDTGTDHVRMFKTEEEAWTYAKEVYPDDYWGSVRVTPMRVQKHEFIRGRLEWASTGDSEYYNGE